jgi:hypothetical protein
MTKKRKYSTRYAFQGYKLLMLCCFSILSGLTFGWDHASASTRPETTIQAQVAFLLPSQADKNDLSSPSSPAEPAPEKKGNETPGENEQEEDTDTDGDPLASHHSFGIACHTLFEGNRLAPSNHSAQNRSTVPLFILYHSWKSYLA